MDNLDFTPFTKRELRQLAKTISSMGDNAVKEAATSSNALATYAAQEIRQAAYGRTFGATAVRRIVDGASISKTSKTGRITYGFASQKFSGGATTQMLWGGYEFGSIEYKQFPSWSGKYGDGSRGWFIYPTLRKIQPELTKKWIEALNRVVKVWDN